MVRRKAKAAERDRGTEIALAGIADGTYMSVDHAVKALPGVSKTTLHRRLKGGKSRTEAQEKRLLLTKHEEKALAQWISTSTLTGNPVSHNYILQIAEKLREQRVALQPEFTPPLGLSWVRQFLSRHLSLKIKLSCAIESARIKDVTPEKVLHFNQELRRLIKEHSIKLENIHNADETGTSVIFTI